MPQPTYFLGSSTPAGFVNSAASFLEDTSVTAYILKGTPGSGKSTLMRKIAEAFEKSGTELFLCSADPDSLDAVYIKEKNAFIMDGTAPHCADPKYPFAVQTIVDLGAAMEGPLIRERKEEVIRLTDEYSACHAGCRLYLSAVSSLLGDINSTAAKLIDYRKLSSFTERTAKRLLPKKGTQTAGRLLTRQLSAVTMNGYSTLLPSDTELYLLADSNGTAADIFLRDFSAAAMKKGYDVMVSRCLISPECTYEHLLIPELSLAFITGSFLGCIKAEGTKKAVSFRRFYRTEEQNDRRRLKFDKKAAAELMKEAALTLTRAKEIHDRIEEIYINASDHDALSRLSYKLISELRGLC